MTRVHIALAAAALCGCAAAGTGDDKVNPSPLTYTMKTLDGKDLDLAQYKGKVVLFVNVASRCGYTPQYTGLQELYTRFEKDGLVVVGVPANDFGRQEPGTDKEIADFCTTNYKVTFPMLAKVTVKGDDKVPLYKTLVAATAKDGKPTEVGWNFEKFLVGRDGKVVGRYKSGVEPTSDELVKAVKTELDKK